eukprot:45585-Eustigmatos_ZCMA.PRE.1
MGRQETDQRDTSGSEVGVEDGLLLVRQPPSLETTLQEYTTHTESPPPSAPTHAHAAMRAPRGSMWHRSRVHKHLTQPPSIKRRTHKPYFTTRLRCRDPSIADVPQ